MVFKKRILQRNILICKVKKLMGKGRNIQGRGSGVEGNSRIENGQKVLFFLISNIILFLLNIISLILMMSPVFSINNPKLTLITSL